MREGRLAAPVESRAAELLQLYGLSSREALVYLLVLRRGSVSAGDIAKTLQLRRMEAYRLVRKLAEGNLIQANAGKPVTYSAQPIESVISTTLERQAIKAKEMEVAREELLSLSRSLPRGQTRPSEQQFKIIQGREQVYNKVSKMAMDATASLDLLITKNDLVQANGVGLTEKLVAAAERGVKVRVLSFVDETTLEAAEDLQKGCEVKHSEEALTGRMTVVDNSAALSSLVLDDSHGRRNDRDVAIYSESPNYAGMMSSLFDVAYRSASGSKERIERVREGRALESRIRSLAEVLQATLPDEGWSVTSPGIIIGKSGSGYEFVASAAKGDRRFGIDVVAARKEQDSKDRAVQGIMKKLDLPDVGIVIVATRGVGEEIEKLAKLMGVTLVQAQDTLTAVTEVRKLLKSIST